MNVREIMVEEVKAETMVKEVVPCMESAYARLNALQYSLRRLSAEVNATDVSNTEEAWHAAYETLTMAFQNCIKEEKKIIVES